MPAAVSGSTQQQASNCGCEVVGHRSCEQRAKTQSCQVLPARRGQSSDASNLDADGRKICKAAQRIGSNCVGSLRKVTLQGAEHGEGYELVQDQLGSHQVAHGFGILPGYAYDPGDRRKQGAAQELVRKALAGDMLLSAQVLLLSAAALCAGLGIAWVDSRPGWDDTGVTAVAIAAAAGLAALLGSRPWLAAALVAAPLLIAGLAGGHPGVLLAVPFALAGAYTGRLVRTISRP